MAVPISYFLAFLCIKLTFCGPVQQKQSMVDSFAKGVNPDCKSFPIPTENSTLLTTDCLFLVPDLTKQDTVTHDLKFKVNDLMCYSALSNMMSLCPPEGEELAAGQDLGVDINSTKVETFCEEAASLKVEHDCSKLNEHDKVDCDLLKKVVKVSVSNVDKCKEICIVDEELFSVCQYLYASTKALSKVWGEGVVSKPTPKAVIPEIPKPPVGSSSKPSTIESQPKKDEKPSDEAKKDADHKGTAEGDGVKTTDDKDSVVNETTDALKNETNKDPNPTNKSPVVVPHDLTTKAPAAKNAKKEDSGSTTFGSFTSVGTSSFGSSTTTTSTSSSLAQGKAENAKEIHADPQVQEKDNKNIPTASKMDNKNVPTASKMDNKNVPTASKTDNKNVPTGSKPEESKIKLEDGKGGGNDDIEESDDAAPEVFDDHQYSDKKDSHYSRSGPIVENTMQDAKSPSLDDSSSSFFSYFILLSIVAIVAYLVFHNKQKILALILEGRRRQGSRRRSGGREYRKLDSNLEDTMNSESYTSGQHVIY